MTTNVLELAPAILEGLHKSAEESLDQQIMSKLEQVAISSLQIIGPEHKVHKLEKTQNSIICFFAEGSRDFTVTYQGGFITALGVTSSWSPSE